MFWKVAGFSQPSPIEQILDKEEFTLEELLNEDDLIQECKSLNGRLVAFLRERSTVEQLIRYMVEPAGENDDPKRTYKYPFTACEVFCCEVEAVFNTLLEDVDLLALLFGLLDQDAPLSAKTAGYFGRLVGHLLLRKTSELMQYLQEHPVILEKLVRHVDTTSISDILKRIVGADEQSSLLFVPAHAQWLSEAPLIDLLLSRLGPEHSSEVQANTADILSAIAHTQPTPLAAKLMREECINTLFSHALGSASQPDGDGTPRAVLVPALDVAIALVEPRRSSQDLSGGSTGGGGDMSSNSIVDAVRRARLEAVSAIVRHLPAVIDLMKNDAALPNQETPYGILTPSLGRARLKCVELVAVLLRSGEAPAEQALIDSGAIPVCLDLFKRYPFNNILHHHVTALLLAAITRPASLGSGTSNSTASTSSSDSNGGALIKYLFEQCSLLDWVIGLPSDVRPTPRPGQEALAAGKAPLRAGYLGHVTHIAATLDNVAQAAMSGGGGNGGGSDEDEDGMRSGMGGENELAAISAAVRGPVAAYISAHAGWQEWFNSILVPRQTLENTSRWECGRPAATDLGGMDSDGDEYQNYFIKDLSSDAPNSGGDITDISGMQPALYHRYNVVDEGDDEDDDDEDDDDDDENGSGSIFKSGMGGPSSYGAHMMAEALSQMHISDVDAAAPLPHHDGMGHADGGLPEAGGSSESGNMDDDEVLLATSDEDQDDAAGTSGAGSHSSPPRQGSPGSSGGAGGSDGGAGGRLGDDLVVVGYEGDGGARNGGGGSDAAREFNDSSFWKPTWPVDVPDA